MAEGELKGQMGTEAVMPKHELPSSQDDGELRRLADSPIHHDAEGQSPAVDLPTHHHGNGFGREEGDLRRLTDSPLQHETTGQKATTDPLLRHGGTSGGEIPKTPTRQSAGSTTRSFHQSPLRPTHQSRIGGKGSGVSSPSYKRKGASEGSHSPAPLTPARSGLGPATRGDKTPDHSPAVPIFGDWDENDPASAERFTQAFNLVREDRLSVAGRVPIMATETYPAGRQQQQHGTDTVKRCCCFAWGRK